MDKFLERMRQVRQHFGMSARAFSLRLKLSDNAWLLYEKGKVEPSARVMHGLAELGISLDWLFCGVGTMVLGAERKPEIYPLAYEISKLLERNFGLKARVNVEVQDKIKVLEVLIRAHPYALSIADLEDRTGLASAEIARVLDGLIPLVETPSKNVYKAHASVITAMARSVSEQENLAQSISAFVFTDVLPRLNEAPSKSVLLMGGAQVTKGGAPRFMQTVIDSCKTSDIGEDGNDSPHDLVHFIFGAVCK